jgi:hypothetical protein
MWLKDKIRYFTYKLKENANVLLYSLLCLRYINYVAYEQYNFFLFVMYTSQCINIKLAFSSFKSRNAVPQD